MVQGATSTGTGSETAFDYTSIPDWVTEIDLAFAAFAFSGSNHILVQVGDSDGFETSNYTPAMSNSLNSSGAAGGTGAVTSGFPIFVNSTSNAFNGTMTLKKVDTSTWACSHTGTNASVNLVAGGGSITLSGSGVLDRVRITRTGSDTIKTGSTVALRYQG
jgi:hypothetical protein